MNVPPTMLFAVAGIVAFDLVASLASRWLRFPYAYATVGSLVIYVIAGWATARVGGAHPIRAAAMVGAATGVAEATVGWAISWAIGPGRPNDGAKLTTARWISALVVSATTAAAFAAAGGYFGKV